MTAEESFIADSFDRRTIANMEIALDRALQHLATGREQHSARKHIASRILACAKAGDKTLGGLTKAGREAAGEISPGRRAPRHEAVVNIG
jgi:hypothetical protein